MTATSRIFNIQLSNGLLIRHKLISYVRHKQLTLAEIYFTHVRNVKNVKKLSHRFFSVKYLIAVDNLNAISGNIY